MFWCIKTSRIQIPPTPIVTIELLKETWFDHKVLLLFTIEVYVHGTYFFPPPFRGRGLILVRAL